MISVSVTELKARLSEHLRRVKAGETIMVTDRGRTIAQLRPPPSDENDAGELQELVAAGLIRLGRGTVSEEFWTMPLPHDPNDFAVRALLQERDEGR